LDENYYEEEDDDGDDGYGKNDEDECSVEIERNEHNNGIRNTKKK